MVVRWQHLLKSITVVLSQPLMYGLQTIKDRNETNKNETSTYHNINRWLVPTVVINRLVIFKQSRLGSKNVIQNFLAIYILWNLIHVSRWRLRLYQERAFLITVLFVVSHVTGWKLKLWCGEISDSRHKILTCLLSVTARGLAIDHRFLNPFRTCLVDKWLQTHPERAGKSFYSCTLVPREPIYVKYLCHA